MTSIPSRADIAQRIANLPAAHARTTQPQLNSQTLSGPERTSNADSVAGEKHHVHINFTGSEEPNQSATSPLDAEAAGYKESNQEFKRRYEKLEQTLAAVQEQIEKLQTKINALKKPVAARQMVINAPTTPDLPAPQAPVASINALALKAYDKTQTEKELEALEAQLAGSQSLESELKTAMTEMVVEERERLEEIRKREERRSRRPR